MEFNKNFIIYVKTIKQIKNMLTKTYSIEVASWYGGKPKEYRVKFKNGKPFSCVFDSEEIANLAAQFYELIDYDMDKWMRAFPLTLKMWGIESQWAEI